MWANDCAPRTAAAHSLPAQHEQRAHGLMPETPDLTKLSEAGRQQFAEGERQLAIYRGAEVHCPPPLCTRPDCAQASFTRMAWHAYWPLRVQGTY